MATMRPGPPVSSPVTPTAVPTTRLITTGTGLSGGGDLSADRTLTAVYGIVAGTAAQGNDARLSDSRAPSGTAGGSLAGAYPNPGIAAGAVTGTEVAAAIKDPVAATAGLRTLGTGAAQAAAGNDSRLSDARTPSGTAGGSLAGTYPSPGIAAGAVTGTEVAAAIKDPAAATAGLRTLGTGAAQACAGNDSRLSDIRTPTAHATTHASAGSDPVTPVAIGALARTTDTFTGDLAVIDAGATKSYKFRTGGGSLDWEFAGSNVVVGGYPNANFSGTRIQFLVFNYSLSRIQLEAGKTIFIGTNQSQVDTNGDAQFTNLLASGKNGMSDMRLCGRKTTTGAPTTGTWATGDTVMDSANAWHFCTAAGTPGTWT